MKSNRRTFLKGAGTVGAMAALGLNTVSAEAKTTGQPKQGMARGVTLLTMRRNGEYRLGAKTSKGILDVKEAAGMLNLYAPATLDDMLQREQGASVQAVVEAGLKSNATQKLFLKEENIEYGPLVTRPEKIICVGLNYRRHAQEIKEAKSVPEAEALSYVAGYATGNDFTARDLQFDTGGQWMVGKTPDGFAPLGPYFITAEQVDPDNLKLECRVNGDTRQSSNPSDMIYNCRQTISYTSARITLRPGDIIFTGTPEGVIYGMPKDKQVWLKSGDKIACSLEKLGELKFDLA